MALYSCPGDALLDVFSIAVWSNIVPYVADGSINDSIFPKSAVERWNFWKGPRVRVGSLGVLGVRKSLQDSRNSTSTVRTVPQSSRNQSRFYEYNNGHIRAQCPSLFNFI